MLLCFIMRTTIDLPDGLFRQVKAKAALRGVKLKEYVAEALRQSLVERSAEVRETGVAHGKDTLALAEGCVLPHIAGETSELLRSIDETKIDEILSAEDLENALVPRRR